MDVTRNQSRTFIRLLGVYTNTDTGSGLVQNSRLLKAKFDLERRLSKATMLCSMNGFIIFESFLYRIPMQFSI